MKPGSLEWHDRVLGLLTEEQNQPLRWIYLSFAEPGRFLGAVLIEAHGMTDAITRAHHLGINPGGEVASFEVSQERVGMVPDSMKNRLLTRAEAEGLGKPQ